MTSQINEILPGLFIGSFDDARDVKQMKSYQISHVVSLLEKPKRGPIDRHYLCIQAGDGPQENISDYISVCNDFIHEARLKNKNVLVHCLFGINLSTAMIMAYIMTVTKFNWYNALNVVRAERCFALPLPNILKQLEEFQVNRLYVERYRLQYKFSSRQNDMNDLEWCLRALRSFEMLSEANPNLYDKIPELPSETNKESEAPSPSTSTGTTKKARKSMLFDYNLEEKTQDDGGIALMDNVTLYPPMSKKDLGSKGKFVDPIDGSKRRQRPLSD